MRILHIIYSHSVSGAEKYLDYLLPGLKKYGFECDLIIICPPVSQRMFNEFAMLLHSKGVTTKVILAKRWQLFSVIKKINKYIKENSISNIHSHLLNTDILVSLIKNFFNRKIFIISTKHGYNEKVLNSYSPNNFIVKKNLYYYVTRYTLKRIDRNVSVSKGLADLFVNLKITNEHYQVLHHGINVTPAIGKENEESYRLSGKQLIIVGRLEIMKGHQYLLAALPSIVNRFPDCMLLILGEGSLKETLEQQCKELSIENNVEFLGFQKDPYSYIANSDVIVLPSLFEPFGLVYIEAHALKVPVVAFDTPAANELMENNITGLLAPKFDSNELANKIIWLFDNTEERGRIVNNAYHQYLEKFTTDIMIKNMAEYYLSLKRKY